MKKTPRQLRKEAQKKKQTQQKIILYGGIGLAVLAALGLIVFLVTRPPNLSGGLMGDEVVVPSSSHVPDNTVPGPYNSNPPAGGAHFDTDYQAQFFQESDVANLPPHPEGHLLHSLEHGYVIFWYNCQIPNTDCAALKQSIQKVMDDTGKTKLIAFPWPTQDTPLAMTSWGRILKFKTVDTALMTQFVQRNRGKAPEPDAP